MTANIVDGDGQAGLDLSALVAHLAEDPRVMGVARLPITDGDGRVRLLVATTWDGLAPIAGELGRLSELVVGDDKSVLTTALRTPDDRAPGSGPSGPCEFTALLASGERLELVARRLSDIEPGVGGIDAVPLHDPQGVLKQWATWSRGRTPPPSADNMQQAEQQEVDASRRVLEIDAALRSWLTLPKGSRLLRSDGRDHALRSSLAHVLRDKGAGLRDSHPAEAALRARLDAALISMPQRGDVRIEGGAGPRERFLSIADNEGFLGDRMLLDAAESHLRALSGREPDFAMGFALGTFDAVEARYALGDPVGGCQPPMLPGIYVGIGITPSDALEFWAAPCVAEATSSTACIVDTGERTAVERSAGKDALLDALQTSIEDAHDALPSLLRRVRGAHREILESPETTTRGLHLPRSHNLAAAEHGALAAGVNRLFCALAYARAATDMEPLVARKLELAAGRLLGAANESSADDCAS